MRIAFVIPGGGGGGVRSVLRLSNGLQARGHEITIFYRKDRTDLWDNVRRLYHAIRYKRGYGWLDSFTGHAVAYSTLTPNGVGDHDVLVGVGVASVLALERLPERCGIKVHNSRGVEPWCAEEMHRAWAMAMPRIVVGTHLVQLMREAGSTDPIYVAPNGIDSSDYFPCVSENERDGVGVVYHGAIVKDPGLIRTVLGLLAERRSKIPLYIFSTFPKPGGLPDNSHFVRFPSLATARELYSRSLVWFMASRNEGFGNPLLEAASCGCVPVSTDCGGARDIIDHEENGLIVPVGDAEAMVSAIVRVLDDADLRTTLRANAMHKAELFTWDNTVRIFENALLDIASNASTTNPTQTYTNHATEFAH